MRVIWLKTGLMINKSSRLLMNLKGCGSWSRYFVGFAVRSQLSSACTGLAVAPKAFWAVLVLLRVPTDFLGERDGDVCCYILILLFILN
jgi:hypothetical protein